MKYVSAILGIALVVVSGLAIQMSREVEAGRQRIADLDAQLQQQAQLAALANRPAVAPAGPGSGTDQATLPAPAPATAAQAATPEGAVQRTIAAIQTQMSSPEGLARRRQTARLLMSTTNPDIDEALGLTPEEADRLLDLLADQQEKNSAVFDRARQSADPASAQQQVGAELQEIRQANEAELQQLLGSKYPQWQDYQLTRAAWQQRRDLTAVLDAAGTPMTDSQSRSLVAALAADERSSRQTADPASVLIGRHTPERHQRLLAAAAPHLTAQQLESYRQMLDRAAAQEQALLGPIREAADARSR